MCTGFVNYGDDLIYGYNLDIDPKVWNYKLVMNKKVFTVAITVGKTTYYTHGVNSDGNFAVLPYMNDKTPFVKPTHSKRIDLLANGVIKNKLSYDEIINILNTGVVTNSKASSLHALFAFPNKKSFICEPGLGYKLTKGNFDVVSNYPLFKPCDDENIYYGKDRYAKAAEILGKSDRKFGWKNGLDLLKCVSVTGKWGTKVSFVYSENEKAVYYTENGDFDNVFVWKF